MKTIIGITSYGNLPFLKLAIRGIRETLTRPADLLVVVAKPDDHEMIQWLGESGVPMIVNDYNKGLAGSVNDIFEDAWENHGYDNVIIMGNDVVPLAGALDAMIECAETTDWEWICATQFDSKTLVAMYPEARQYFTGDNLQFTDFEARPWELHKEIPSPLLEPHAMKDVRNLALFKRSVFDKIGYCDVNYWPNSYYEDNSAVRRALLTGVNACGLRGAVYFHFWSRTIHQGESRPHGTYFQRNGEFYRIKWGGDVGAETYQLPFNGQNYTLGHGVVLPPVLRIADRSQEREIVSHWMSV